MPALNSPMNLFSASSKTGDCYASIIQDDYDTSKDFYDPKFRKKKPGIRFDVFGQTKKTRVFTKIIFS